MKRLQSLSYKTLFAILFFTLAGIVFFLKIGSKTTKVSAAWWDDAWHYRKAISITNSSGSNLTDFQVSVSIGTSQLIADGKMQNNCNDIRITDINGNLLPYWIEENNPGCNSASGDTKIWIKASSLPTSGSTVYVYYGNSSANNNENGDNVFEFFDDFNDANKTNLNWTATGTGFTVTDGNLYHSNTLEPTNSFPTYTMNNTSSFTDGVIESRIKPTSCGGSYGKGLTARYTNDNNLYTAGIEAYSANNTHITKRSGGGWTSLDQDSLSCNINTWYSLQWTLNGTSQNLTVNGVGSSAVDASFSSGKVGIQIDNRETPTGAYWDYFFVRKYATSQPTTSNQSEETGGGPVAYWKFDEGSGTTAYDSTTNQNNCTLGTGNSAPTWTNESQCISGKCLSFDGNDYLGLTDTQNSSLDIKNQITMSVWVRPTSSSNLYYLISKNSSGGYSDQQFSIAIDADNNQVNAYVNGTGVSHSFNNYDTWSFISATWDGSYLRLYQNGKLLSTASYSGTLTFKANFSIGRRSNSTDGTSSAYTFYGYLDDVKIYPYARTANQIKQDYNSRGSMSGAGVNLGVRSNTAPSLKSSLVAHYKFDEGNGTIAYDSSGNNYSGIMGNGTSSPVWANGKINKSLNYDGNDYVDTQNIPGLNNTFSISLWTKANNYSSTYNPLICRDGNTNNNMILRFDTSGNIEFRQYGGSEIRTNNSFPLDTWIHIVAISDNLNGKIYVNGKLEKEGTFPVSFNDTGNISFGKYSYNPGFYFNGLIDEVKIYNKALTPEEVKQDYNAGSVVQFGTTNQTIGGTTTSLEYCIPGDTSYCAAPVAEWKMDEGVGTSIVDTSGSNNTGTISGATFTQGKIGKALSFNGTNNYVSIPTFSYTTNATISVWVKGSYTNGSQIIVGSPNSISLGIYNVGSSQGIIGFSNTSKAVGIANNFINDSWNHLSVVIDNSGNATYYCNGQLLSNSGTNNWSWSSGAYIGRRDTGTYFKGQIDQLKIYNYARTPAQIAYDYNKGGPIGWWKFDECQGSTAYDWSGNQNNGTIIIGSGGFQNSLGTCAVGTSAAWTNGASGKINSSLNFDGTDDYVSVINNNLFNFSTNDFTISLWAKKTTNTFQQYGPLISKGIYSGVGEWNLYEYGSNNSWNLYCNGSNNFRFNADIGEKWGHILIGRRMDQMFIYFNGQITNPTSDTISGNNIDFTNTKNLTIGTRNNGSSYFFNGQIDDVRIYNYALTSEQIKQIYNGGSVNFN